VFVTMKLPQSMTFDGKDGSKDRTDFYLAALNSHDGSGAFKFLVSPVRIVCANTQNAAIARAKASFAIRHTGGARAAIQESRVRVETELALRRGLRGRGGRALRRTDGRRRGD
jgi:hypothetical protein